jgi:hypothetical protein
MARPARRMTMRAMVESAGREAVAWAAMMVDIVVTRARTLGDGRERSRSWERAS